MSHLVLFLSCLIVTSHSLNITLNPSQNTHTSSSSPTTPASNDDYLTFGYDGTTMRFTYIEFDVSSIYSVSTNCLSSVQLYLTADIDYNDPIDTTFSFDYLNPTSWNPQTLTWDTQSTLTSSFTEMQTFMQASSSYQTDARYVTLNIQNVFAALSTFSGKILLKIYGGNKWYHFGVYSSESSNSANYPFIIVEYSSCSANTQCQLGKNGASCAVSQTTGACANVTCVNGGICDSGTCTCPTGYAGTTCNTMVTCATTKINNVSYPTTQAGFTAVGQCPQGYFGAPTMNCNMPTSGTVGTWDTSIGFCTPLYCLATGDSSSNFPTTPAMSTVTTSCNNYYFSSSGTANRTCDANGVWGSIQNPCNPIYCSRETDDDGAQWEQTQASSDEVYGICVNDYSGNPSRICGKGGGRSGLWGTTINNPCVQTNGTTCPPVTYDNAIWPRAAPGTSVQATQCVSGYYSATLPSQMCNSDGSWNNSISNPCQLLPLPPSSVNVTSITSTSAQLTWDPVSAAYYLVQISQDNANYFAADNGLGSNVTQLPFSITGLTPYTQNYLRVYSINSNGFQSSNFTQASFTTPLSPSSSLSTSSITETSVSFSWSAAQYATWYSIFLNDEIITGGNQYAGGLNFTITGLTPGQNYNLKVCAGTGFVADLSGKSISFSTLSIPTPTGSPSNSPSSEQSPTSSPTSMSPGSSLNPTSPTPASQSSDNQSKILGGVLGTFIPILVIGFAIFAFFLLRRRGYFPKRNDVEHVPSIDLSRSNLAQYEEFHRSSGVVGGTTLLLTSAGDEIALPGYAKLDFAKEIRIEKQIAGGGEAKIFFGSILNMELRTRYWAACDVVAIKQAIEKTDITQEESITRFHQEVAVLNSLSYHPNIIKLMAYSDEPKCIVTPLYEGNLDGLIHNNARKYSSVDVADIVYQILSGMDAVHSKNIAHRDLKPLNIMLERRTIPEGQRTKKIPGIWSSFGYQIKIGDFGICFVSQKDVVGQLKIANSFGISIPYAAPEIFSVLASGKGRTSVEDFQNADIYSFAINLWELVHRKIPWEHLEPQAIQEQVMSGARPVISIVDDKRDNKVSYMIALIESGWNQDLNGRPSFKEALRQLKGLMDLETFPFVQT